MSDNCEPLENKKFREKLLTEKDVVVLTKQTFFRTVNQLFQFSRVPERRSWEFFSYRPLEYILVVWCATFNIDGSAFSCGAQHPFILRQVLRNRLKLKCTVPDYVLMSHNPEVVALIVEIKPLGDVDPDSQWGRKTAESIFYRTWKQRENQATLAFHNHPTQTDVQIMMVAGPWFCIYTFERSEVLGDGAGPENDERLGKIWRRSKAHPYRIARSTSHSPPMDVSAAARGDGRDVEPETGAKRKRGATNSNNSEEVIANHVFQLAPDGEPKALNPHFLHLLAQIKRLLENIMGPFEMQNSWFDWPVDAVPEGDGHAEGFVLPNTKIAAPRAVDHVEEIDVERLDDEDLIHDVPSTPRNARNNTVNNMKLNALLSPKVRPPGDFGNHNRNYPTMHPADSNEATDDSDDTTPKDQHRRQPQGTSFPQQDRELSPSAAYLERRQRGPVNSSQFYPAPPDSSPPRPFLQKLCWPPTDDGSDSESLTNHFAGTPGPVDIPRPVSALPTSISPPSRIPHNTTATHSVSRGHQSWPHDRSRQERVMRPIPSSRRTTESYRPLRPFQKGALVRPLIRTTNDHELASIQRHRATVGEWERRPPTADELLLHVFKAPKVGKIPDYIQGFRNAGMSERQAARARARYYKIYRKSSPPRSPSKAIGSGSTTATSTAPPASTRRPATHTATSGEGPSHRVPSGITTMPSTMHAEAGLASSSHPPPMDEVIVVRTTTIDGSDSEWVEDDDVPLNVTAASSGSTSADEASGGIRDSSLNESDSDLEPSASEAQVNRLAKRIGNLGVTNVPGSVGSPKWGDPSLETLFVLGELARESGLDLWEVFRNVGMDERQAENALKRYNSDIHGKNVLDVFHAFLAANGAATMCTDVSRTAHPVEGPSRTTARSDVHPLLGPSSIRRQPSIQQTNPGFALPGPNREPGPSGTNTSRKGKAKEV